MSDPESSSLLAVGTSSSKAPAEPSAASSESTPLLGRCDTSTRYDGGQGEGDIVYGSDASSTPRPDRPCDAEVSAGKGNKKPFRLACLALALALTLLLISAAIAALKLPGVAERYAKEAAVLEPTSLSLESITTDGVTARVRAVFRLDGSRVKDDGVRGVGKATTWLVRELGTEETRVGVYLPEHDNVLLGTAKVPPLVIDVVNGHTTEIDLAVELVPGNVSGILAVANEWLDGRLDALRVKAAADVRLKSGILPLGAHAVSESLTIEAENLTHLPQYNITSMEFRQVSIPGEDVRGVAVEASLTAFNEYPISIAVPELAFDIFVPGCRLSEPYIHIANAVTRPVLVRPHSDVAASVTGLVRDLPESLVRVCPDSSSSPLDMLLKRYLGGDSATVFVRGGEQSGAGLPDWLANVLASITLPVPFPGRSFDNIIRNFSLTDVHFTLPSPSADPEDPDAKPKVSGTIEVISSLPAEMNFDLNVTNVKARANVFYHSKKLGVLDLRKWQRANSTRLEADEDGDASLQIHSRIEDAPLDVTDSDVMTDVIQALLFGGEDIILSIKAAVDVKVQTVLGPVVLKDVPAEGEIPVKPLPGDALGGLNLRVGHITILDTAPGSMKLEALVNVTNPTPYTAFIPYISTHVLSNGSLLGEAAVEDMDFGLGENLDLKVSATWDPSMGGSEAVQRGRDVLSEYLSGSNTTLTLRAHRGSIPSLPQLGDSLSRLNMTVAAPRLRFPGNDEDEEDDQFIRDATFHIFSSMATFTLVSPLQQNTLFIEHVNATAFYNHTEPIGVIEYHLPFACPPGPSQTPKLPVQWSLDSVGYEKLKQAIGGHMKLDAKAVVSIRIGAWRETVRYAGSGIGARVSL